MEADFQNVWLVPSEERNIIIPYSHSYGNSNIINIPPDSMFTEHNVRVR